MKRETKYIAALIGLLVVVILVEFFAPPPINWNPSYLAKDKNPFGAFVTYRLLTSFFNGASTNTNNLTLYELADSIRAGENIVSLSNNFDPDDEAVKVLLNKVDSGSNAFISAYYFSGKFADTLKLFSSDVYFTGLAKPGGGTSDTTDLKFVLREVVKRGYYYRLENVSYYFTSLDSLRSDAWIISTNAWGKPVTMRIPFGKGSFILNTTPLAFTNNYLLYEDNAAYAAQTLSFLPPAKTWWTSYYQMGRMEAETPIRFILKNEALRWAYYIIMLSLILFIFFEAKRKQRIIPILRPLVNTTLEFVRTIGNMYLQANDHRAIAEKKIAFFLDQVRSNYYMGTETGDNFVELLAKKSGNPLEAAQKLFALIKIIQGASAISEGMLMELNLQIEHFNSPESKNNDIKS